jgi:hypothetical protein
MLSKALDTFGQLELPQDGEWIHLVLSYLKAWVEQSGEMLMYGRNRTDYVRELVSSLKTSLDRLETGMVSLLQYFGICSDCCLFRSSPPRASSPYNQNIAHREIGKH